METTLTKSVININELFKINKLSLNATKARLMQFHRRRKTS